MIRFHPSAFGLSLGLSLAFLSLLCWVAAVPVPSVWIGHGWLALFSNAPPLSFLAGLWAVLASFVGGWIVGFATSAIYNRLNGAAP